MSKVAQQAETISLINSITAAEAVDISESQNECMIKIGMTLHESLTIIIYEVIMVVIVIAVKLLEHAQVGPTQARFFGSMKIYLISIDLH